MQELPLTLGGSSPPTVSQSLPVGRVTQPSDVFAMREGGGSASRNENVSPTLEAFHY